MRFGEIQRKPTLYLDMDGVLADFFGEWARSHGVSHYKQIDKNDIKASLDRVGKDAKSFFENLPVLPGARQLLRAAYEYGGYTILSSPLERKEAESIEGKRKWIAQQLGDYPPNAMIFERNKAKYAVTNGTANVLIDDYGVNVRAWEAAGGRSFKHRSSRYQDSIDWLREIKNEVEAIKPSGFRSRSAGSV